MAFFNEFPNTRTYDSDLGWIIRNLGTMIEQLESLSLRSEIDKSDIAQLKEDIREIIEALRSPVTEWDASKEYPIYSMVTYLDDLYVALQNVPVGVGIGDTNYWAPSSGLVTLISQLQSDVADMMAKYDDPGTQLISIGYKTTVADTSQHTQNSFNIIKTYTGKTVFVDMGWEYNEADLAAAYSDYGITTIDVIILTHYHTDHCGNLEKSLNLLNIADDAVAYIPPQPSGSWDNSAGYITRYNEVVTALTNAGITIINPTDQTYYIDESNSFTFFNTGNEAYYLANGPTDNNGYNNNSYCLYFQTGSTSILFTSDIEELAREYLLPEFHRASILQMPHHGYGLKFPETMLSRICPDLIFCNNADGITPPSGTSSEAPRLWNALYVEAKQKSIPVLCNSSAPNYDLIMYLTGKVTANAPEYKTAYEESYGQSEFSSIALACQEYYSTLGSTAYETILDKIKKTSKTIFAALTKINFTPKTNCVVENIKTNAGQYPESLGNDYLNINRFTGFDDNWASGEVVSQKSGNAFKHHIQNRSMGNFYRFNAGAITAGNANNYPNMTIQHGNDIIDDTTQILLQNYVGVLLVHLRTSFANAPTTGSVDVWIGTKRVRFWRLGKDLYETMIDIQFTANSKIYIENNTDEDMTQCLVALMPLSYGSINESSFPIA